MKNDRRLVIQPINYLLKIQILVLVGIVLISLWLQGNIAAIASLYGGTIAVANTLLQRWHLIIAVEQAKSDAGKNLRKAYICVVHRWVFTIVMFAIGFALFRFLPLPLMAGFTVTQLALLFGIKNQA